MPVIENVDSNVDQKKKKTLPVELNVLTYLFIEMKFKIISVT